MWVLKLILGGRICDVEPNDYPLLYTPIYNYQTLNISLTLILLLEILPMIVFLQMMSWLCDESTNALHVDNIATPFFGPLYGFNLAHCSLSESQFVTISVLFEYLSHVLMCFCVNVIICPPYRHYFPSIRGKGLICCLIDWGLASPALC